MNELRVRFPIRFDRLYELVSRGLLLAPSASWVEVGAAEIRARMGWAFRTRFPRAAVTVVARRPKRPLSRGVHGFAGRWLVNGSGEGIVVIDLSPTQRAWVIGFPVRLRQLSVSVEDPFALMAALQR